MTSDKLMIGKEYISTCFIGAPVGTLNLGNGYSPKEISKECIIVHRIMSGSLHVNECKNEWRIHLFSYVIQFKMSSLPS